MMQQGVDQRAVGIARRRVDHQPGGLVDHDQVRVLEHDVQRYFLRLRLGFGRRRHRDGEFGPVGRLARGLRNRFAGDRDRAFADQRLDPLARQPRGLGERLVEPLSAGECPGDFASAPHAR